jgi:hypothetical protein
VLSEFRTRLISGNAEMALLDQMLQCLKEAGLLKARGRHHSDAAHVLAAARALNRLALVGETMRQALNTLVVAASDWLRPRLDPEWSERYGRRFDEYGLPKAKAERQALAGQIGDDGRTLLRALYAADAPVWLRKIPAVEALRQVWLQQKYAVPEGEPMRWRRKADLPPAGVRIHTPYDVEARYCVKRSTGLDRFQGPLYRNLR